MSTTSPVSTLVENAKFYSSALGDNLMSDKPHMRDLFIHAAAEESLGQREGQSNYPYVGAGYMSRVVLLDDNYCLKTSGPWSGRKSYEHGGPTRKPSLIHEMHLMTAVGQRLQSRDRDIYTPSYYMACSFPRQNCYKTTALLQSKLPDDATSFLDLARNDEEQFVHISKTIRQRVGDAVGYSALRLGMWDIHGDRQINPGNVLLGPNLDPEGPLYLIDLVGPHPVSTSTARIVSLLRRVRCV